MAMMEEVLQINIGIEEWEGEYEVYWNEDNEGSFDTLEEAKAHVLHLLSGYVESLKEELA
jgi:hypothetical protein